MMKAIGAGLALCARYGRFGLVFGLILGLMLPGLAQAMRPWLPYMVAGLLFVTAFRVGYPASVGQIWRAPRALLETLILQLLLPLLALGLTFAFGLTGSVAALAIILMLCAPSISGSANFASIMGHDPAPAMQVLVIGTALFPLTTLPVLWALGPGFGIEATGMSASLTLIATILGAAGAGFAARAILLPDATPNQIQQLDGLGVASMVVIVIGLMAGIGPLLSGGLWTLSGWLLLVLIANFGSQIVVYHIAHLAGEETRAVPLAIVSGNRNVALFLIALPEPLIDQLLPFIGCYQIPMYLTPLVMRHLYARRSQPQ